MPSLVGITNAANPPSQYQQNPDVYACCSLPSVFSGWTQGDLSTFNPITTQLRGGNRTVRWSYQVMAGCSDGDMKSTLLQAMNDSAFTGVSFVESSNPQLV